MLVVILDDEALDLDPVLLNGIGLLAEIDHIVRRAECGTLVLHFDRRRKQNPYKVTLERHIVADSVDPPTVIRRLREQRQQRRRRQIA